VTETIETYGLKVRSPVNMQTGWREDYSHCEAKYFLEGMEWIDLQLGRHPLHAATRSSRMDPASRYIMEAIASTIHCQRPSRKTD
jgi:hypothetical protein